MSQSQPATAQEPAEPDGGYTGMITDMRAHYIAYRTRVAQVATARAAVGKMRVPHRHPPLQATPACAWGLVHHRGMSVRDVAAKLGIRKPGVLELLADYRAVAEAQELRMLKALDAANASGGGMV